MPTLIYHVFNSDNSDNIDIHHQTVTLTLSKVLNLLDGLLFYYSRKDNAILLFEQFHKKAETEEGKSPCGLGIVLKPRL